MCSKCRKCTRRVPENSRFLECRFCNYKYHIKCISLNTNQQNEFLAMAESWMCPLCLEEIFPFNKIEEEGEFLATMLGMDNLRILANVLEDKIFQPFEVNDQDHALPGHDIDPDINFYNEMYSSSGGHCNYYSEDTFRNAIATRVSDTMNFSLIHLNIRSMKKNLGKFDAYLDLFQFPFSIIALSETWLHDHNAGLYRIDGYRLIEKHRTSKKGGGVAILMKNELNCVYREDLSLFNEDIETVFIEIDKSDLDFNTNVLIGVIYRPPGRNSLIFNEHMTCILETIKRERKICYLPGDYNIDLLNHDTHGPTSDFLDILYANSLVPLINRPTRITSTAATLIDNIFTNHHDYVNSFQGAMVTDITDHLPIFYVNWSAKFKVEDIFISRRVMNESNKQCFQDMLCNCNWDSVYNNDDASNAFDIFHQKIMKCYNDAFPKIQVKLRYNNKKPWLTQELRNHIKTKNKLHVKFKTNVCDHTEILYKRFRNRLNHLMRKAEKQHYSDLITANKGNMKKTWQIIKGIINKRKNNSVQTRFKGNNGLIVTDGKAIAEAFNCFFTNVGSNLAKKIPKVDISPVQFLKDRVENSLFLSPVIEGEIHSLVKSLKQSSPGYDDIDAFALNLGLSNIAAPLTYLCNLSLSQGVFPTALKIANVIPLYKADDPMAFNNYRPVSLLCTISKIFEKVMYNRVLDFLEKYKILYELQFGFRKSHSTHMALMLLLNKLTDALEQGRCAIGIFLDFSKAFDTVNHEILLSKLDHYGIRGNALEWFRSYLFDRKQFVTYNKCKSSMNSVNCGVPQGSILGPLLFLIYVNDIANVCELSFSLLFADDTNVFNTGDKYKEISDRLNKELKVLAIWLKANKLSLNIKKTQFMLFGNKKNLDPDDVNIVIDGHTIQRTTKSKFLGVIIDEKLNWKHHITYICNKISKGMGIILKARNVLNKESLVSLYYTMVYPYLTYCNHVWGTAYLSNLSKLITLQKKIVKIILNVHPRTESAPLFKELGFIRLVDMNRFLIAKFMHLVHSGMVPSIIGKLFVRNCDTHNYSTRQSNHYHVPIVKSNMGKSSIHYKGVIIWNTILNASVPVDVSPQTFKYHLKNRIINGLI